MCKVSVITAVYNGARFLRETIESVLEQSFSDFEMVLVDDGSTDGSVAIIKEYQARDKRIRLYENPENKGIAYTKNRAIDVSRGEYIAILDHDDIALPNRLETEAAYLDANPQTAVVSGKFIYINEKGEKLDKYPNILLNPRYIRAYLILNNALGNGAAMFRKSFADKHHVRYRDNMYGVEDYYFWVECSLHGTIVNLNEDMFKLRTNPERVSEQIKAKKWEERKKVFDEIHRFALEGWGFILEEHDYDILNKAFMEDGGVDSIEEIRSLFDAMQKINRQAAEMDLEIKKEIHTMCRKRFGEKVGKAFFLWE